MLSGEARRLAAAWEQRGRPLDVPGGPATRVWQQGDGEAVVCLHGVPVSAFLYRKVLDELAARGLRGVAFDLPGLGFAERPAGFDYRWSSLGAWAAGAIDALGLDRFHLVVHDIGGPVGFEVVARMADRVASLTVLNTMVRVASFRRPLPMEPFAIRGVGEAYLRVLVEPGFVLALRAGGVVTPVPGPELAAHLRILRRGDGGRAFLRVMRSFERTEAFQARILGALAARPFPAQVVWGERDPFLRIGHHGEHARHALGAEDVVRLDAGHFVPEDRPAELADRVAALAG